MKKALIVLAIILMVFATVRTTNAVTLSISSNLPGIAANPANPGAWINGFYTLALMLGGVLAFGAVVYGGVLYAASAGNPSKQSEGKDWILSALLGLLLLAGAYLVLNTINPGLTNIAFPTLSPLSATQNGNSTGQSGTIACQGSTAGTCPVSGQTCSCTAGSCSCQSLSSFTCGGSTYGTCLGNQSCIRTDSGQVGTSPTYGCQ